MSSFVTGRNVSIDFFDRDFDLDLDRKMPCGGGAGMASTVVVTAGTARSRWMSLQCWISLVDTSFLPRLPSFVVGRRDRDLPNPFAIDQLARALTMDVVMRDRDR